MYGRDHRELTLASRGDRRIRFADLRSTAATEGDAREW
jgi:hypothetical protein